MDGRHLGAGAFGPLCEFRRIHGRFVPAQAHLDRYGNRCRLDHGRDQTFGVIEIPHERGAGQSPRHPPRRTAHVDVDEDCARVDHSASRFRQSLGVASDDLNRMGHQALALGADRSFGIPLEKGLGRDHLGKYKRSPEAAGDPPHGQIADAGHRGKQRPSLETDRSYRDRGGDA